MLAASRQGPLCSGYCPGTSCRECREGRLDSTRYDTVRYGINNAMFVAGVGVAVGVAVSGLQWSRCIIDNQALAQLGAKILGTLSEVGRAV